MVREVLPVVRRAAVLAGVCATDPFRDIPLFLRELRDMGVVGIQVRVPLPPFPFCALTPRT
jgi:predicted TIM-barrel enzyme